MSTTSEIKKQKKVLQGRWSKSQKQRFVKGFQRFGKNWVQVQKVVKTRTLTQVRSHAQKMFLNSAQNGLKVNEDSQDSNMICYQDESMSQNSQTNFKHVHKNKRTMDNLVEALNKIVEKQRNSAESQEVKDQQTKLEQNINLPPKQALSFYIESDTKPSLFLICLTQKRDFLNNGGTFLDLCFHRKSQDNNLSC